MLASQLVEPLEPLDEPDEFELPSPPPQLDKKIVNNKIQYISKSSINKKHVPSFLIEKSLKSEDLSTLINGLKLIGDYLDKSIKFEDITDNFACLGIFGPKSRDLIKRIIY